MQLTYQKLTKDNIIDALKIKHQLFPESNSDEDYNNYFCGKTKSNYYLILEDNNPCATIGWYDFDNTGKNAFVGWFGVLSEYQHRYIGIEVLNYIIDEVKALNYDYLRVYTDKEVNFASTKLYNQVFDFCEDYTYPDKLGKTNNFVIYTKCFKQSFDKWNNAPLNEDDNYSF